jgi:hypothetical protein
MAYGTRRVTTIEEERERQEFALAAAASFTEHPTHASYGKLEPGSWLALRWGLHDRAVMVLRLAADFEPLVYADLVDAATMAPEPEPNYRTVPASEIKAGDVILYGGPPQWAEVLRARPLLESGSWPVVDLWVEGADAVLRYKAARKVRVRCEPADPHVGSAPRPSAQPPAPTEPTDG